MSRQRLWHLWSRRPLVGVRMAHRWTKKELSRIDAAKASLPADEPPIDQTIGFGRIKRFNREVPIEGVVLLTHRRVVFWAKRFGGHEIHDFQYAAISSVDYVRGRVMGRLDLHASGASLRVQNVPNDDIERIAEEIRRRLVGAKGGSSATPYGPAAELAQLAELHARGALSDAEFSLA